VAQLPEHADKRGGRLQEDYRAFESATTQLQSFRMQQPCIEDRLAVTVPFRAALVAYRPHAVVIPMDLPRRRIAFGHMARGASIDAQSRS